MALYLYTLVVAAVIEFLIVIMLGTGDNTLTQTGSHIMNDLWLQKICDVFVDTSQMRIWPRKKF